MKQLIHLAMISWYLLMANTSFAYTKQDTLRGSNGIGRKWWDVQYYDLNIKIDTATQAISGSNTITLKVVAFPIEFMQIDLKDSMLIDSVKWGASQLSFTREGNVWWVKGDFHTMKQDSSYSVKVFYHGKPCIAKLPPWDGGFIWTKDSMGKPWISVACQGLGASSWWPCKDYQGDEPDAGMKMTYAVPSGMRAVSNGKLLAQTRYSDLNTYTWEVRNPINSYDVSLYVGDYINWTDTMKGEPRILGLDFWALRYNEEKAKKHFAVTKQMLHCFEYWMGQYPFYEDGYKLVEAPFLGMEHQSAVAYGNEYKMGYLGRDRSNTGVGTLFDFIIVHESGHEWFGNNITAQDIADNWLHEGFTTYTEALFAECAFGKEKAYEYTRGEWENIRNDVPVIGGKGVNDDGSSDKYDKGSAVVHMIRTMMNNDEKFRQLLRGLNKDFYHKIVTSSRVEAYIMEFTGLELNAFFNQYLYTTQIPQFEWYVKRGKFHYKFNNTVQGFTLPLKITDGENTITVNPSAEWQEVKWKGGFNIELPKDFLINEKP
jgi:aminopeptidase N